MALFILLSGGLTFAQEVRSLETLKAKYEGAADLVTQPIKDLNAKYIEALEKLLASEAAAGELDRSLEIKTDLEAFGTGKDFDETRFVSDASTSPYLARLRETYLMQRVRVDKEISPARAALLEKYLDSLIQLEKEQTRLQQFEAALETREAREEIQGASLLVDDGSGIEGRIHFVVKGEIEMELNGERLDYRDSSDNHQYISGVSRPRAFAVGDVISMKMRGEATFRSVIMAMISEDEKTGISFSKKRFRILPSKTSYENVDASEVEALVMEPAPGPADGDMLAMWKEKSLPDALKSGSQWAKLEILSEWNYYAVVLTRDMFSILKE